MPNFSATCDLNIAAFSGVISASDICIISIMSCWVNVVFGRAEKLGGAAMMSSRLGIEGDVGSFSS